MLEEIQAVRDALGDGAVHPALADAILRLNDRVSLLEIPADDPPVKAPAKPRKGGE